MFKYRIAGILGQTMYIRVCLCRKQVTVGGKIDINKVMNDLEKMEEVCFLHNIRTAVVEQGITLN